jgi:predicted dehydrogenase
LTETIKIKTRKQEKQLISRRKFLKTSTTVAATAAAFSIVPRHVLGQGEKSPSDTLNIGIVGIGGQGAIQATNLAHEKIFALCDTDWNPKVERESSSQKVFNRYPNAIKYQDYREMLDKESDIDGVVVATPDHTHTVIASMAIKKKKHVYVQKPLTHNIGEARYLTELARKHDVVTQMGNQGRSFDGCRDIKEWIDSGVIGEVHTVENFTDRPIWEQGNARPTTVDPIPDYLNWDVFLGPAPFVPYNDVYRPFHWRGWKDWGTGALGDMACHIIDPVFYALDLTYPTSVEASCTIRDIPKDTFPPSSMVYFTFPATDKRGPINLNWYDGGIMPRRPEIMDIRKKMGSGGSGSLFIGDKGILMCECYGKNPTLVPYTNMKTFTKPPKTIKRIVGTHEQNWVDGIRDRSQKPTSNFDVSGPLTEMVLMGNLAIAQPYKHLLWDGDNMKMTNNKKANELVMPAYREEWAL